LIAFFVGRQENFYLLLNVKDVEIAEALAPYLA